MKLKRILWTYEPHKDGRCDIKLTSRIDRKTKVFSTGYSVLPTQWDKNGQVVKRNHPLYQGYNFALQKLQHELEDHLLRGGTFEDFRKKESSISLTAYCEKVIKKAEKGLLPLKENTIKSYRGTHRRLKEYAEHFNLPDTELSLDKIDIAFYDRFCEYLKDFSGCGAPGISKHIKIVKSLMSSSLEENLHTNEVFRAKAFKRPPAKPTSKIYLSRDEMEKIEQLDLSGQPMLERERDRFLLAYWLLMRFSDVTRLERELVFALEGKRYLRYRSEKTGVEATLPLKQSALDLLEKYNFKFSYSSNVQANRHLKTIAAMAGINTRVSQDSINGPKSNFVTTHTARRSAATNLYLDGVNMKMIADLGGWTDMESLRLYLRASGLETAQIANDLDFFT